MCVWKGNELCGRLQPGNLSVCQWKRTRMIEQRAKIIEPLKLITPRLLILCHFASPLLSWMNLCSYCFEHTRWMLCGKICQECSERRARAHTATTFNPGGVNLFGISVEWMCGKLMDNWRHQGFVNAHAIIYSARTTFMTVFICFQLEWARANFRTRSSFIFIWCHLK